MHSPRPPTFTVVNGKSGKWRKNVLKIGDIVFKGGPDDTIVLVMGPPDSGKSTFIQTLLNNSEASPGGSFHSRTKKIEHYIVESRVQPSSRPSGRLVAVEIPSFDDTLEGDRETLREISAWLAHCYEIGMKFGGAIYLHDISLPRLTNSVRRNLDLFRSICGRLGLSAVSLTTTKWSCVNQGIGEQRERQLKGDLWKDMIAARSSVRRFDGTFESAWKIINDILHKVENTHSVNALWIQQEVVDLRLRVPETDAGRLLYSMLVDMRTLYRERIRSWKTQFRDSDMAEELQVFIEYEKRISVDINALEIGVWGRVRRWIGNSVSADSADDV